MERPCLTAYSLQPIIDWSALLRTVSAAFLVYKLRVKIYSRVPLNCIKRYTNTLKGISVLQPLKNTEVEIRLHIQRTMLAIIKIE